MNVILCATTQVEFGLFQVLSGGPWQTQDAAYLSAGWVCSAISNQVQRGLKYSALVSGTVSHIYNM